MRRIAQSQFENTRSSVVPWSQSLKNRLQDFFFGEGPSSASKNLIQTHRRRFSTKLNEKLIILDYNIHDIQLAKSLYDMLPNREQVNTDWLGTFEFISSHNAHFFQIDAVRRLWRLKYKSGKRATIQQPMAFPGQAADHPCNENVYYQPALKLANDLISTSMHNIVQARLRNMDKRNHQIHTFQQEQRHQLLP